MDHLSLLDCNIGQSGSGWLLPSGLSVCDPYLACCLRWSLLYPMDGCRDAGVMDQLPSLRQMVANLETRPAVKRALALELITGPAFTAPHPPDLAGLDSQQPR